MEVSDSIYSVKTSTKDDRCFVTTDGSLLFCSIENCKIARSVKLNSSQLANFTCPHINEVVKINCLLSLPLAYLKPNLDRFVAGESLKTRIKEVIDGNCIAQSVQHVAMQVSDTMFCVFGPATASNPLGFCHVRKCSESSQFICTGKDCRGFAAKGKQTKTKSMWIHVSVLLACFSLECSSDGVIRVFDDSDKLESEGDMINSSNKSQAELTKRLSTIKLAEKIKMLPRDLLDAISKRDACMLLGVDNGWPDCFSPDDAFNCVLCSSLLGDPHTHPGQAQNTPCYLITELNPFKKVQIKVKICSSPTCSAMHQASVEKLGKI